MNALSDKAVKANFDEAIDAVCKDHVPVVITRQNDAERLRASIADAEAGKTIPVALEAL